VSNSHCISGGSSPKTRVSRRSKGTDTRSGIAASRNDKCLESIGTIERMCSDACSGSPYSKLSTFSGLKTKRLLPSKESTTTLLGTGFSATRPISEKPQQECNELAQSIFLPSEYQPSKIRIASSSLITIPLWYSEMFVLVSERLQANLIANEAARLRTSNLRPSQASPGGKNGRDRNCNVQSAKRKRLSDSPTSLKKRSSSE
jgi:hypothetical protein